MRECRRKASAKSLAAFGSSILKFAVMLDVTMLSPRFPFKGIIPQKKNESSLAELAAKVNWGTAANRTFEAVFQAVSSFFAICRLAAIDVKMNLLLGCRRVPLDGDLTYPHRGVWLFFCLTGANYPSTGT